MMSQNYLAGRALSKVVDFQLSVVLAADQRPSIQEGSYEDPDSFGNFQKCCTEHSQSSWRRASCNNKTGPDNKAPQKAKSALSFDTDDRCLLWGFPLNG